MHSFRIIHTYDNVLYEEINERDHKYRFFFSLDDYDYLEDKRIEIKLDSLFEERHILNSEASLDQSKEQTHQETLGHIPNL